jgi:hypothetical protein
MEGQALQARIAAGTLEPLLLLPAAPLPTPLPPPSPPPRGGLLRAREELPPAAASDGNSNGRPEKRQRPAAPGQGTVAESAVNAEGWPCAAGEGGSGGRWATAGPGVLRHTAPIAELLQATQDRLYSRLFNS